MTLARRLTHLGSVQRCSIAGCDTTAQQTHLVQRGLVIHFGQGDLSHHCVLRECAAAHEVEEALALAGETGGPIWHQAFALSEPGEHHTSTNLAALRCTHKARLIFNLTAELQSSTE